MDQTISKDHTIKSRRPVLNSNLIRAMVRVGQSDNDCTSYFLESSLTIPHPALHNLWQQHKRKMPGATITSPRYISPLEIPEILDKVLGHLSPSSLKYVTSFVCRSWFLHSRRHIPQHITTGHLTNNPEQLYLFQEAIRNTTIVHWTMANGGVVSDECFRMAPSLVALVDGRRPNKEKISGTHVQSGEEPEVEPAAQTDAKTREGKGDEFEVSSSVCVRHLSIDGISNSFDKHLPVLIPVFKVLTSLTIDIAPSIDICSLLDACPNLVRLSVRMLMVDSYSTNATVGIVTTTHTRLRSLALTSFTMTLSVLENMFTRLPGLREVRLINLSVPASEGKNYHENNLSRNNYDPSDKQLTHHPVMKILSRYCQGLDAFEFSLHNYPMAKERDYIQIYERVAPNSTDWVLGSENLKHYQNDQQPPVQIPEPQPQRQDEYYEEEQQGQQCPPQESSTALGSSPLSSSLSCRPVPFPAPIPTNPRNLLTTLKFTHPVRSMILNRHWDEVSSGLHNFLQQSPFLLHLHVPNFTLYSKHIDPFEGLHPFTFSSTFSQYHINPNNGHRHCPRQHCRQCQPWYTETLSPRTSLRTIWACQNLVTLEMTLVESGLEKGGVSDERTRVVLGYLVRTCPNLERLDITLQSAKVGSESGFCLLTRLKNLKELKIKMTDKNVVHDMDDFPEMDWLVRPEDRSPLWRVSQFWCFWKLKSSRKWRTLLDEEKEVLGIRRAVVATTRKETNIHQYCAEVHNNLVRSSGSISHGGGGGGGDTGGEVVVDMFWERIGALTDVFQELNQLSTLGPNDAPIWPKLTQFHIYKNLRYRKAIRERILELRPWIDTSNH